MSGKANPRRPDGVAAASVEQFFKDNQEALGLRWLSGHQGGARLIKEASIHRPGLALAGFFSYFADKRVQIFGGAENAFLRSLSDRKRRHAISKLMQKDIPCIVFTRNITPDKLFISLSGKTGIPIFSTAMVTYSFINGAIIYLDRALAPSVKVMGTLVDVHGTGVLIRGPSGIGKSECALALIRRGSALVADDVVRITRIGSTVLSGSPVLPEMCGYMEIRGLGLINIIQMFGASSFRHQQDVQLVVAMKHWESAGRIDRTGLDSETYRILGVRIPHATIPVAPGRETANLIEVAAQEFRMRSLGMHAGRILNDAILRRIAGTKDTAPLNA